MRGISNISKFLGFGLLLATAGAPTLAQAETAQMCHAQLGDLDHARQALESLESAVDDAKASRTELEVRKAELDAEIPRADGEARPALVAERDGVIEQLGTIADLLPAIETQARALRADVDATERAYITCIEATID